MPITADLTSHDYLLPDDLKVPLYNPMAARQQQAAPRQEAAFQFKPETGLENVEGRHDNYYKAVADLNGFAHKMKSMYNIDVTSPDPRIPDSVQAHKIFTMLHAHVLSEGDKLKEGQKIATWQGQQSALGNIYNDPSAYNGRIGRQLSTFNTMRQEAGPGHVSDFAKGVETKMKGYYNAGEVEQAKRLRQQAIEDIDSRIEDAHKNGDMGLVDHLLRDKAYLGHPSLMHNYKEDELALKKASLAERQRMNNYRMAQGNSKKNTYDWLIKEWGNVLDGNHAKFQQSSNIPTPSGGLYLENNSFTGQSYPGGVDDKGKPVNKVISKILLDPETNQMFIKFDDGSGMQLQRNGDSAPYIAGYLEANPKLGSMKDVSAYSSEMGWNNQAGGIRYVAEPGHKEDSQLYIQNAVTRNNHVRKVTSAINHAIDNSMGGVAGAFGSGSDLVISTKDDKPIKFTYEGTAYTGKELKLEPSIGSGYTLSLDGQAIKRRLSKEQAKDIMHMNSIVGGITDGRFNMHLTTDDEQEDINPKITSKEEQFGIDDPYINDAIENGQTNDKVATDNGSYSSYSGPTPPQVNLGQAPKPSLYE